MGGDREGLLLAGELAVAAEDDGAAALVLVQQGAVGEVVDEAGLALDARVADVAHLLAVELLPLLGVEALVQRRDVLRQHLRAHAALLLFEVGTGHVSCPCPESMAATSACLQGR